jgi:predicted small lipoprotein YifL
VTFVLRVCVVKKSSCGSCLAALVAAFVLTGCGKKGPPLAPIVRIPAPVTAIQAQRVGSDAFVTVTIPAKNIDGSAPIDIGRVEVYGYTGRRPPPNARWVEVADLVATIPVIVPLAADAPASDTTQPVDLSKGALAGSMVTVVDPLTPAKLVPGTVAQEPVRGGRATTTPLAVTTEPDVLHRFYIAIGFSERGRPGPPGTPTDFPLIETPEPPTFVNAAYTESTMSVEWPPSGGIVGFLFDSPLPQEEAPLNELFEPVVIAPVPALNAAVLPGGPVRYNVYRELAPDPLAFPDATAPVPWATTSPAPVNPAPLATMSFTDTVEFDRERCYVVRPIRGMAPNTIEGDPSPANCFTPVDVFPPAAPARLAAVADEGGISLIWEPNAEPDVTGYMVLRGEAGDATLQPLTPAPVAEPRFRDTHVSAGKKYVYAVVALDSRLPVPNMSGESERIEETAR